MSILKEFIRELQYEDLSGSEARVLIFLLGRLSFKKTKFRKVKKVDIEVICNLKKSTVADALTGLLNKGIIISEFDYDPEAGSKNRYCLNADYVDDEEDDSDE